MQLLPDAKVQVSVVYVHLDEHHQHPVALTLQATKSTFIKTYVQSPPTPDLDLR